MLQGKRGVIAVQRSYVADTTEFDRLLAEANLSPDAPVLADKRYSSMKNRTTLKERSYIDGIMHKAARGKPLTFVRCLMNGLISNVRYRHHLQPQKGSADGENIKEICAEAAKE
jgi:IS5 family transposase